MAIPPINSLTSSVVYKSNSLSPSTSAKVQIAPKEERAGPSSFPHAITVIHPPQDPGSLGPLLEESTVAPADSEVALNESSLPPEVSADKTQSIFRRFFCCGK
ncbi:hypothetical protein [Candidatus Rhabdochlamydia sp. T3358]|uniref:hypothetical protein n=1 Tax=Candidatus Rhabdochlamydia sp. T3358 TaxID=2099795 RepID=UPI0010B6738C|nr:hypothetical protein [Candidatus Rhabdochlamydia sp. T3358]VHO02034.1 hypothetical protein RHT_00352 [Candidatus Rhabdochlamydia sp. T3358]